MNTRQDWIEELSRRTRLACEGDRISVRVIQNMSGKRPPGAGVGNDFRAWLDEVKAVAVIDPEAHRIVERGLDALSTFSAVPSATPEEIRSWMTAITDALRVDTGARLIRSHGEPERRRGVIAVVAALNAFDHEVQVRGAELEELFGIPRPDAERWLEWGAKQGYLERGVAKMFLAAAYFITSEGVEWLQDGASEEDAPSSPERSVTPRFDVSFMHDPEIRAVVELLVLELTRAVACSPPISTAVIVLCGAIGEGVLFDALKHRQALAMAAPRAPRVKGGAAKDLEKEDWRLFDYIQVAEDIGLLPPHVAKMAHDVLRDFRNLIHPKVQVQKRLRPDAAEAAASVAWLEAVLRDVSRAP